MPMYAVLQGIALEALETGWNQLIERHESLRTVFPKKCIGQRRTAKLNRNAFQSTHTPPPPLSMLF